MGINNSKITKKINNKNNKNNKDKSNIINEITLMSHNNIQDVFVNNYLQRSFNFNNNQPTIIEQVLANQLISQNILYNK